MRDFQPVLGIDPIAWSDEQFDAVFDGCRAAYEAAWRPFPDAVPCLEALRLIVPVAALSNGDQDQQEAKVSRAGLGRYLDVVLSSSQLGVTKPDPSISTRACHQLGVPPEATVHVGDRREADAVAASTAGLRGVWLNRTGRQGLPWAETIDSLAQLLRLIGHDPAD